MSWFGDWLTRRIPAPPSPSLGHTMQIQSPWSGENSLAQVAFADIWGRPDQLLVTREMAMQVPAVAKARHLVCSTLAQAKFVGVRDDQDVAAPRWLTKMGGDIGPRTCMMALADDVLFYGWALVWTDRDAAGEIETAKRVPKESWTFDAANNVIIGDGYTPTRKEVILVVGPSEGLLISGSRTIRGALDLDSQWQARVKNPVPVTELHVNDPSSLYDGEDDEAVAARKALATSYAANRRDSDGGMVTVTPSSIDLRTHGEAAVSLFENGRNAVTLDVARHTGIPASELDASQVSSSLKYSTVEAGRIDLVDAIKNLYGVGFEDAFTMAAAPDTEIRMNFDDALSYRGAMQAPGARPAPTAGTETP